MTSNNGRARGFHRSAKPQSTRDRLLKRKREVEDIEALSQLVADLDVKPASPPDSFSDLPLSQVTQSGLQASHFKTLTPVQAQAIPVALKGRDVLGSAKTGSGKTLAFIIPVLDNLYRRRWTEYDGVGALILSPTRELAVQIFDVLRKVGRNHTFSAGLVIGGKSLQEERDRLGRMNILVATPGRILQHMDQNAELEIGNLQMLVLDEADRIMDMGFQSTVDAIVEHLPTGRQTLLFSATQTKKVSDLARLSLKNPDFVSVNESSEMATPSKLQQNYVLTPIAQKLDTLWSFLRSNTKKKILVFLSSGKQVRFLYEALRHLQPGLSLLHLHGRQKQSARFDITTKFSNSKHACLLSTDVAARGLDFPAVDWVVQVDCPEDADTYIHRVGRTARYNSAGRAVLFLDPSEEQGMLEALDKKKVSGVEVIHIKQKKMQNTIQNQLQNMCFKDPELKYLGQKAFVSYVRSVFVQKDKSIFDVKKLDLEAFATSLGLPGAPRVKFVKGDDVKKVKNMPRALAAMADDESDEDESNVDNLSGKKKMEPQKQVRTKYDRMFERRNQDVLAEHYAKMIDDGDAGSNRNKDTADADSDDEFMAVKTRYGIDDDRLGRVSDKANSLSHSKLRSPLRTNGHDDSLNEASTSPSAEATTSIAKLQPPDGFHSKKAIQLSTNPAEPPLIVDSNRRAKLLQSRKALLKFKGHGSHVVFDDADDDDNQGKEKVYYEEEQAFKAAGDAGQQRERFVESEVAKTRAADSVDRDIAKAKRREKKIKRKERERDMYTDDKDGNEEDMDAGVQLLPYEDDRSKGESGFGVDSDDRDADGSHKPRERRKRKWFEDAESDEEPDSRIIQRPSRNKKQSRIDPAEEHPQTLEDLEAMASGLLAR